MILVVVLLCSLLSGGTQHNLSAIELCFYGGTISDSAPDDYRNYIEDMQDSFALLDSAIATINGEMEGSDSLDSIRIKSLFYAIYFGTDSPSSAQHQDFVESFVTYEERTRTIELEDGTTEEEVYTVAVPIQGLSQVEQALASLLGTALTTEQSSNATEIYYLITYDGADVFPDPLDVPFVGIEGFVAPVDDWESCVSSEFGYRTDPFTGEQSYHGGIDFSKPEGTPIYSVLDGTVTLVRYSTSSYGYYVMVDHGGGFVTLYAHCSAIYVSEGQTVTAGETVAAVGTTGRSTGNHLHFEIQIDGKRQNPRSYLP